MDEKVEKWTCFADAYEDGMKTCLKMIKDMLLLGFTIEEIDKALTEVIATEANYLRQIEGGNLPCPNQSKSP